MAYREIHLSSGYSSKISLGLLPGIPLWIQKTVFGAAVLLGLGPWAATQVEEIDG